MGGVGDRPPQSVKFARRTSSGRVVSLSRDDDLDLPEEYAAQNDYINYTILIPPTPDNQPGGTSKTVLIPRATSPMGLSHIVRRHPASLLEEKWSGIALEEWWRNERFWVIGGTGAHLAAVIPGLLRVIAVPLTIIIVNLVAPVMGAARTVYSVIPQWSKLFGGAFFSFWVLAHMYPFCKGLMRRRWKMPTIIYVWAGLISITVSLLKITISPPQGSNSSISGGELKT
ncbi:Cellulose synthase-like protein D1 [Abeliophyllum distichum]|uniref:Cellulose synthase-like protein D1 n=1 Tax=Abeliophyllum distichum TaxID=126358 RepID=A0ABD1U0W2_9LAMI